MSFFSAIVQAFGGAGERCEENKNAAASCDAAALLHLITTFTERAFSLPGAEVFDGRVLGPKMSIPSPLPAPYLLVRLSAGF